MSEPIDDELAVIPPEDGYMDETEAALAKGIYTAIQDYSRHSERGLQSAEFRLGVSDLGYCSERARRMLDRQIPDADVDLLKAFIGTCLGDGVEGAVAKAWPSAIIQSSVEITLYGERNTYTLPGHPDIILPDEGVLLDGKSAFGLALARRTGMEDQQKRFQRHCYGYAAWEAGMFGDRPIEEIKVGNVWIDRAGIEQGLHVKLEPLDVEVVEAAARWLDEVVYAWQNKVEAPKEPAREVCETTCGYFRTCREWQTDTVGLLEDDTVVTAVNLYAEGHALFKQGEAMKKQAKAALQGVRGSTGEYTVRWTWVNRSGYSVGPGGYDRLDIKPVRKSTPKPRQIKGDEQKGITS